VNTPRALAHLALALLPASVVAHDHETSLRKYLRVQRRHGYWRVLLHMEHRGHAMGDSYSNLIDHVQPPLAMLAVASLVLPVAAAFSAHDALYVAAWVPAVLFILLLLAQLPMTLSLLRRTRSPAMFLFAPMSTTRAIWRGIGMIHGAFHHLLARRPTDSARATGS